MHGREVPDLWVVLVLLGTSTPLPALGWIGWSRPTGGNGVHDAGDDGFFSSLTFLAVPVPVHPASAARVEKPRVSIGPILGLAPPGLPAG